MKKKIIWLVLSGIMVAALVLASCAPAAEEKPPAEPTEPAAPVGPQYGGTYTYGGIPLAWNHAPTNWDVSQSGDWAMFVYVRFYQSVLLYGDVEKYGPRGTNVYPFNAYEAVPPNLLAGDLVESWTLTAEKIEYKLREGIMWQGNENIGMAKRELTAEDVAFTQNYFMNGKLMEGYYEFVDRMYAKDKYTFVVETNSFSFLWDWPLAWGVGMYPPEVMEAGPEKWENQVASGPFILTDYQKDVQVIFEKNPDYYLTTSIDGKEYKLPFVDKLVLPIIHDDTAKVAAIRTAKIDAIEVIDPKYKQSVSQTSPDIIWHAWPSGVASFAAFMTQGSIFESLDLRRAMAVGTDRQAIVDTVYLGEGEVHSWLGPGSPIFTPLKDLPADAKMLFEYNPDKAKEMLADAGYPDGFGIEVWFDASLPTYRDIADLLSEQWAKIGVDVKLVPVEHTAHRALRSNHEYNDVLLLQDGIWPIEFLDKQCGTVDNAPNFCAPYWGEEFARASQIVDDAERNVALNALAIYYVDQNVYMQLGAPNVYIAYWPWVKNFWGETDTGYIDTSHIIARLWLDQALKTKLGH